MNLFQEQFCSLLSLAINGGRPAANLTEIAVDWNKMFNLAEKQTVMGVVYDAISKLPENSVPDRQTRLKWHMQASRIEMRNDRINTALGKFTKRLQEGGLNPILLKGQSMADLYPVPNHRQSGDIDFYFPNDCERANRQVQSWPNTVVGKTEPHHQTFICDDVTIENHSSCVILYNEKNRRAWEHISATLPVILEGDEYYHTVGDTKIAVPHPQWNVLYIFLHWLHHFTQTGVGFRQTLDWCIYVRKHHDEIDWTLFKRHIEKLRIKRAVSALTYAAVNFLGFSENEMPPVQIITSQSRKDGILLIEDIFQQGNFGHSTDIMKGLERGNHLHNIVNYYFAIKRMWKLRNFYSSEIFAYPTHWLKRKFNEDKTPDKVQHTRQSVRRRIQLPEVFDLKDS